MLLLTNYRNCSDYIQFPCILQEKLDGVRCLIRGRKGYSRSGKEIASIGHILDELTNLHDQLDGELYSLSAISSNLTVSR